VLVLEAAAVAEARALTLGAAGWRAPGTAVAAGPRAPGEEDLWRARTADGGEVAVLCGRPGRVRVFLRTLEEPEGDPAAFALACGQLFDAFARPREEVVPLGERADAGAAEVLRGAPPSADDAGADAGKGVAAILAGVAALLALVAARAWRPA
jgi:hypothetical protein